MITNDLHRLVYDPLAPLDLFQIDTGTYTLGPCFYVLYVWMVTTIFPGLILLFRETGRRPGGVIRSLLGMVALWYGLVWLNILVLDKHTNCRLFNVPEIHIFGILGVIEICIRRPKPLNQGPSVPGPSPVETA